eukprot:14739741-Heterocapsa_arctica.AAC.1
MSYGHRAKRDRATFMARYIMFEDLENKAHMKALKSIVTGAYASGQNVKHKGDIVEIIMEMGFNCSDGNYEVHAY